MPTDSELSISHHHIDNGRGHELYVRRTVMPGRLDPKRRPLLVVPGYGMNSFIFGYHPRGTSLMGHFAAAGFEVWTFDLRRTGRSKVAARRAGATSLEAYITEDLPAVMDAVLERSECEDTSAVDVVGASLGGTIVFAHLALNGAQSRFGTVVAIGAPLRWEDVHPAVKIVFGSPWLMSKLKITGAKRIARAALPIIAKVPKLLSIYMNPAIVDLRDPKALVQTVEDPNPRINADIARWIKARDLELCGVNVTQGLAAIDQPLLLVIANKDGIVPPATALAAEGAWGGDVETLHVGDEDVWYAHADLFIGDPAPMSVFEPITRFLLERGDYARA